MSVTTTERTVCFVKAHAFDRREEVWGRLHAHGLDPTAQAVVRLSSEKVREFYAELADKPFPWVKDFFASLADKDIDVAIFEGSGIIQAVFDATGATDPQKAAEGTIRYEMGQHGADAPDSRKTFNVVHRSANPADAAREVAFFARQIPSFVRFQSP